MGILKFSITPSIKSKTTKNDCKTSAQSPNSLDTNPKGGNGPLRIFLAYAQEIHFLKTKCLIFHSHFYFLLFICIRKTENPIFPYSKDRKPYFSLFERQKALFFLIRKTENPIFPYSKDRKHYFSLFERQETLLFLTRKTGNPIFPSS